MLRKVGIVAVWFIAVGCSGAESPDATEPSPTPTVEPTATPLAANKFGIGLVSPGWTSELDRAAELAGRGGHVKFILDSIVNGLPGPDPAWAAAVDAAYDRNLVPVVRMNGPWSDMRVVADDAPANTDYSSAAAAFRAVAEGLPRRDGHALFLEVWNEPNLSAEWGGDCDHAKRAREYARFFAHAADAIHSIGDARIQVMNAGLAPNGDDCGGASPPAQAFLVVMKEEVPDVFDRLDALATHSYPFDATLGGASPPPNAGLLRYEEELSVVARPLDVYVTETGYSTNDVPDAQTLATYTADAWRTVWLPDARVKGVMPFTLTSEAWTAHNWVEWGGAPRPVFARVRDYRRELGHPDS